MTDTISFEFDRLGYITVYPEGPNRTPVQHTVYLQFEADVLTLAEAFSYDASEPGRTPLDYLGDYEGAETRDPGYFNTLPEDDWGKER